jgi:hypothetical protein
MFSRSSQHDTGILFFDPNKKPIAAATENKLATLTHSNIKKGGSDGFTRFY